MPYVQGNVDPLDACVAEKEPGHIEALQKMQPIGRIAEPER